MVVRIAHRDIDLVGGDAEGEDAVLARQLLGQDEVARHYPREAELNRRRAALQRERLEDLRLRREAERHEHRADALPRLALLGERRVELRLGDRPALDEDLSEKFARHRGCLTPPAGAREGI